MGRPLGAGTEPDEVGEIPLGEARIHGVCTQRVLRTLVDATRSTRHIAHSVDAHLLCATRVYRAFVVTHRRPCRHRVCMCTVVGIVLSYGRGGLHYRVELPSSAVMKNSLQMIQGRLVTEKFRV